MEIEDKLLKFRKQHQQEQLKVEKEASRYIKSTANESTFLGNLTAKFHSYFSFNVNPTSNIKQKRTVKMSSSILIEDEPDDEKLNETEEPRKIYFIKLGLKFLLWATLYALFIKLEFGVVYFIISLLVIICLNTNIRKKKGKISAYSVFNPNVERIDGTLTSEQIEKSLVRLF